MSCLETVRLLKLEPRPDGKTQMRSREASRRKPHARRPRQDSTRGMPLPQSVTLGPFHWLNSRARGVRRSLPKRNRRHRRFIRKRHVFLLFTLPALTLLLIPKELKIKAAAGPSRAATAAASRRALDRAPLPAHSSQRRSTEIACTRRSRGPPLRLCRRAAGPGYRRLHAESDRAAVAAGPPAGIQQTP